MKRLALGSAVFLLSLGLLFPVAPRKWSFVSSDDFLKGTFTGVSSSSEGLLGLAPREDSLDGPDEEFFLSFAQGKDGTMFLGTGHAGKIYRLTRGGRPELFFQTAEMDVTSLVWGEGGALFAGTSPGGKIYKITAKDKGDVFFNPDEKYIWDLLAVGEGKILAAVGEGGGIYEIDAEGRGRKLLKTVESHILCLAREADGDVLAGSAGNGFLFRVTRSGQASVVFDPSSAEVKAVALDGRGGIYFAACGAPSKPGRKDDSPASAAGSGADVTVSAAAQASSPLPAAASSASVSSAGPSTLYRISPDGRSVKLWSSEEEFIHDAAWDEDRRQVLFGTGNRGRLYAADAAGKSSLLFQKKSEQITVLFQGGKETVVLSNNPARADILLSELRTEGEYLSPVLDAGLFSSWGRISWQGELPAETALQLQTRSGNAPEHSSAWSEWSPPCQRPEGEPILSPKARYLQFRALFRTNSGRFGPALRRVDIHYLQANAAPVVTKVAALDPDEVFLKLPRGEEIILGSPLPAAGEKKKRSDDDLSTAKKASRRGYRTLIWEANDENGDGLAYRLSVRRAGESAWRTLAENWEETVYALDTLTLPDGIYEFRVVASDKISNPLGAELRGEKTSRPVAIDNTPPVIKNLTAVREGPKLKVGFQVEDALSPLVEVRVLVRPREWQTVFPADGICDSRQETFSFVLELPDGSDDLLTVVALDENNNRGVHRRSFAR
ncbi:MAG: fibronectin type III domain-containing protein [Candidatus Aminicenantes bacterium]|nr:fibronectin type III domain-containing protein [Candidatus Aminicenantes bacterium]